MIFKQIYSLNSFKAGVPLHIVHECKLHLINYIFESHQRVNFTYTCAHSYNYIAIIFLTLCGYNSLCFIMFCHSLLICTGTGNFH